MNDNTKKTILVVDDEEGIREIVKDFFERKDYTVYTAGNGLEALEILKQTRPGCCFTDINMPKMDGLELAEKIREMDNTLPVVIMTGFPSLDNTIRTLKNGVVDYLIKPVSLDQMELCYMRIVRERTLFVENLILKEEVERQERIKTLNNELVARADELNVMNRIMDDFSGAASSNDIFAKVVDLGVDVLDAEDVSFYIYNEETSSLVLMNSSGLNKKMGEQLSKSFEKFIIDVISDDQPCLVSDNRGKTDIPEDISSLIVVPLKIRDKTFGVVTGAAFNGRRRFNDKDIYYMKFITQKAATAIENMALYENIYDNLFATLYAFVAALEARDPYTRRHSSRVTEFSLLIGKKMNCSEEELDILNVSGQLHDIGKIGIRDDILLKPGRLTRDEYEKIKEHPVIGADIVAKLGLWNREQNIIRHHHEKYDGTGYPDGLKGEEIPKLARILSMADAFDAMASDRAYRKGMEKTKVVSIIKECSGSQFDPSISEIFLNMLEQMPWPYDLSRKRSNTGEL